MKGDDEAAIRANGCAAALRALDTYEAAVYPADPRGRLYGPEKPASLQRMRDKLRAIAYASDAHWMDDLRCMFGYFGNSVPEALPGRMGTLHYSWIAALSRLEVHGPVANCAAEADQWRSEIKQLEPAFFADREARKAAVARASSSSAAPAAAAALGSSRSMQQAMTLSTAAPASTLNAAGAASRSVAPAAQTASLTALFHSSSSSLISHAEHLERVNAQLTVEQTQLRHTNARLVQAQVDLQRQLAERTTELTRAQEKIDAAAASQAERLITVKQEKIDAVADAHGAAQQAAKAAAGKRKAESELESEAKRRRSVEGELASLTEQMDEQDKCIVCFDKQPDALFLRCKHLVCCSECAETILRGAAAGAACPTCRKPLRGREVVKVFRA